MLNQSNTQKVMEFFFKNPTRKFSIRDIAKEVGLTPPTVANIIRKLEKLNYLKKTKIKPSLQVYANLESEDFKDMKRVYNLFSLIEIKNFLVHEFNHPQAIVVYGSYAKGEDIEKSDVDILIISKVKKKVNVDEYEKKLKRSIHILVFDDWKDLPKELRINVINGIRLYGVMNVRI